MPNKPNDADVVVGAWNQDLVIDRVKLKTLNKPGLDITLDQIRQLYTLLYPFIQADFKHRDDLYNYIEELKKELEKQRKDFNQQLASLHSWASTHTHIGNLGSPTSAPVVADTQIVIPPISDIKTEDALFVENGCGHVIVTNTPKKEYTQRDTTSNENITITGNAKQIEDLLTKGAKIFIPFDVGEKDSVLVSEQETLSERKVTDI